MLGGRVGIISSSRQKRVLLLTFDARDLRRMLTSNKQPIQEYDTSQICFFVKMQENLDEAEDPKALFIRIDVPVITPKTQFDGVGYYKSLYFPGGEFQIASNIGAYRMASQRTVYVCMIPYSSGTYSYFYFDGGFRFRMSSAPKTNSISLQRNDNSVNITVQNKAIVNSEIFVSALRIEGTIARTFFNGVLTNSVSTVSGYSTPTGICHLGNAMALCQLHLYDQLHSDSLIIENSLKILYDMYVDGLDQHDYSISTETSSVKYNSSLPLNRQFNIDTGLEFFSITQIKVFNNRCAFAINGNSNLVWSANVDNGLECRRFEPLDPYQSFEIYTATGGVLNYRIFSPALGLWMNFNVSEKFVYFAGVFAETTSGYIFTFNQQIQASQVVA